MKKLLIALLLLLCFALVGCDSRNGNYGDYYGDEAIAFLDDCDYYLLRVVDRRDSGDGYEYLFQENGQGVDEEWTYSDKLFSLDDWVLGIEYETTVGITHEEFVLYDLS